MKLGSAPLGCLSVASHRPLDARLAAAPFRPVWSHVFLYVLCAYALGKRALSSRFRLGVKTMRRVRARFYEGMWKYAARAVGLRFGKEPDGTGVITRDGLRLRVRENQTSLEQPRTLALTRDKVRARAMLKDAALPVPRQISVTISEATKAWSFLETSAPVVVVKPAADTGAGAGVSASVNTPRQLRAALAWARAYGPTILIEEQIEGDCYRVLIMDGQVIDVVLRRPLLITGDGLSTIRQLIRRENWLRRRIGIARAQMLVRIDPDLRNTLAAQNLHLSSRPAVGVKVVLKRVINENRTADNRPANDLLCSAILETARQAALRMGVRLAGVDLICSNPAVPLECGGGAIIEVNANPGLYYHFSPERDGHPIVEKVLTSYFRDLQSSATAPPRDVKAMTTSASEPDTLP